MARKPHSYHFEMPYQVEPPQLTNVDLGIDQLRLTDDGAARHTRLTLLDTPDERLLRDGVLLGRHEINGVLDWWLHAPSWRPWLPVDRIIVDGGELPDEFARLTVPFRRRATLQEASLITRNPSQYGFVDPDGTEFGGLVDERVTIRRGDLAISRYRHVTLDAEGMTAEQREFVISQLVGLGAIRVTTFADPIDRIASPGLAPGDLAEPREWPSGITLEEFLIWLFGTRLRTIIAADLAVRSGQTPDTAKLRDALIGLLDEVRALSGVLDPEWVHSVRTDVEAMVAIEPQGSPDDLGTRYLDVLDALVAARQAPRLGGLGSHGAKGIVKEQVGLGVAMVEQRLNRLDVDSPEGSWRSALSGAEQLARIVRLSARLFRKGAKHIKVVDGLIDQLRAAQTPHAEIEAGVLAQLHPQDAFQAGRAWQQDLDGVADARRRFLKAWPKQLKSLPPAQEPQ